MGIGKREMKEETKNKKQKKKKQETKTRNKKEEKRNKNKKQKQERRKKRNGGSMARSPGIRNEERFGRNYNNVSTHTLLKNREVW